MLKLIYTEDGLHLEQLSMSVDAFVTSRQAIAQAMGDSWYAATSAAAMLLPADTITAVELIALALESQITNLVIEMVDADYVEIAFTDGIWLATSAQAETGVFVVELGDRFEANLRTLWQMSVTPVSFHG